MDSLSQTSASPVSRCKKIERVLLLMPYDSYFYVNQALALRRAFARRGIDCLTYLWRQERAGTDDSPMLSLIVGFKPDLVISVNSFKPRELADFAHIPHVLWLQDNNFLQVDFCKPTQSPASEIFYAVTDRLARIVPIKGSRHSGILRFAADPCALTTSHSAPAATFSLIAFIPERGLLDLKFGAKGGPEYTGWDYLAFLSDLKQNSLDPDIERIDDIVAAFLARYGYVVQQLPPRALALLKEEFLRTSNRARLVQKVLSLGLGCAIYGNKHWLTWPEFAPHYRKIVPTAEESGQIFQSTVLNIHNGGTLSHPRVFECAAAAGGTLMANRMDHDEGQFGFEPGVHYVEYDLSDFDLIARDLLQDEARRRKISANAYDLIRSKHNWDSRVDQILSDVAQI